VKFYLTIAILAALAHALPSLAQERPDHGPTVAFGEGKGAFGCYVDRIVCGEQSCDVYWNSETCAPTVAECLLGHYYASAEDEEGTEILGCATDRKSAVVTKEGI
jgi:hypothetical protein